MEMERIEISEAYSKTEFETKSKNVVRLQFLKGGK